MRPNSIRYSGHFVHLGNSVWMLSHLVAIASSRGVREGWAKIQQTWTRIKQLLLRESPARMEPTWRNSCSKKDTSFTESNGERPGSIRRESTIYIRTLLSAT